MSDEVCTLDGTDLAGDDPEEETPDPEDRRSGESPDEEREREPEPHPRSLNHRNDSGL